MQRIITQLILVSSLLAAFAPRAQAQSAEPDQQLRATVLRLIDSLVDAGVLTRTKADELIRAAATTSGVTAVAQAPSAGPEVGADGKRIVRVPYVPESLKREMRDSIRQDVLAQARTERWGEAGALPDWLSRISIDGDIRVRADATGLSKDNTNARDLAGNALVTGLTRAADIISQKASNGAYGFNTQDDSERTRLRMRLNVDASVTDELRAGVRLSTGNNTDRVSTNQTLGQNFNKYSVVLDRVFLKWNPAGSETSYLAGRMPNPFFGTDLVWDPDLNFEGAAAMSDIRLGLRERMFATVGWFPLTTASPGATESRDLIGAQAGIDLRFGYTAANRLRVGLGHYYYRNLAGAHETEIDRLTRSDYLSRSEYPSGLRQRGNTLFRLNAPSETSETAYRYGLASEFQTLNLTAMLELVDAAPVPMSLTGDVIRNLAFKRDRISARTGQSLNDGSGLGYLVGLHVGKRVVANRGDWSTSIAYRYLGSDATLDAFADSDFGLGGTNNKGTVLTLSYGLDRNIWVTARWLSSNLIDPWTPATSSTISAPGSTASRTSPEKFSADVLHLDLNARF
jgi:hypothetical protein